MPLLDVLDPERRLLGVTPRGPLSLPPGGAHWYVVPRVGYPDHDTFHATVRAGGGVARRARAGDGHPAGADRARRLLAGRRDDARARARPRAGRATPALVALSGFIPVVEGWELDLERELPPVAIGHGDVRPDHRGRLRPAGARHARARRRGGHLPRVAHAALDRPALRGRAGAVDPAGAPGAGAGRALTISATAATIDPARDDHAQADRLAEHRTSRARRRRSGSRTRRWRRARCARSAAARRRR